MRIQYATFSEAGTRPYNEDYIRVVEMPEENRTLFVLCDGMGGHAMGDLASRTVGDVFANYWQKKHEFKDCEKKVRESIVPLDVIESMLSKMTLPEAFEARQVEWICI